MSSSTSERRALLVSAVVDHGRVRVNVDDAVAPRGGAKTWEVAMHVSSKELELGSFTTMAFDEKELADLAFFLLARLAAFNERGEL